LRFQCAGETRRCLSWKDDLGSRAGHWIWEDGGVSVVHLGGVRVRGPRISENSKTYERISYGGDKAGEGEEML